MPSKANKKAAAAERAAKLAAEGGDKPPVEAVVVQEVQAPPTAQLANVSISSNTENSDSTKVTAPQQPEKSDSSPPKKEVPYVPPPSMGQLPSNKPLQVTTNSYLIDIKKTIVYRYDVSVEKFVEGSRPHKLAGEKGADRKQQQTLCKLMEHLGQSQKWDATKFAYDGAMTLHSVQELKHGTFDFKSGQLPDGVRKSLFRVGDNGEISVTIVPNAKTPKLNTTDILNENLSSSTACPVTQMLQILLSQEARRKGFIIQGSQYFDPTGTTTGKAHVLNMNGVEVGIKVAQGASGSGALHLILDYARKQFFESVPLTDLGKTFTNRSEALKFLKGLKVKVCYSTQEFVVQGLSRETISEIYYDSEDGPKRVLDDAAEKAGKKLKDYNFDNFAVQKTSYNSKLGKKMTYTFPIENLKLVPNQTLTQNHGDPPTCVEPEERLQSTEKVAVKANLLSPNATLKAFGFTINPTPINVNATRVPAPRIAYQGGFTEPSMDKGKWSIPTKGKFIAPAKIETVLVLYNTEDHSAHPQKLRDSAEEIKKLWSTCNDLGMTVGSFVSEDIRNYGATPVEAIEAKFAQLKNLKTKPLVIYVDGLKAKTHSILKLQERLNGVATQQMCVDKALKRDLGRSTLVNNALKLNLKAGGFNHKVLPHPSISHLWGDNSNTLIISYDVCHASGTKAYTTGEICEEPSCVGFTYNGTKIAEAFIGDYHYQLPRQERVDEKILTLRTRLFLAEYYGSRKKFPDNIVILRDGVSEGQHGMVYRTEFPAIRAGVEAFMATNKLTKKPKYAYLLGLKRHDNRLYLNRGHAPPLIAIDRTIVKKVGNEMILLSHVPLKGTAQPIVIDTIVNENVFKSKDEIINFITAMSCAHQVSLNIVGLPESIYGADDYAERGSKIFEAYKQSQDRPPFKMVKATDRDGNEYDQIDYDDVTAKLSYYTTPFRTVRIA